MQTTDAHTFFVMADLLSSAIHILCQRVHAILPIEQRHFITRKNVGKGEAGLPWAWRGKGVGSLLCEAPFGPFRQKTPDPFSRLLLSTGSCSDLRAMYTTMLAHIAGNEVANRPGRIEPRVLKRRRHRYPLMQRPRDQLRAELGKT